MKLIAGPLVLLICAAGMTAYMVRKNGIERDKAVHEAAIADSEEINRGIKLYYERKNKPLRLHNDLLRVEERSIGL